MEQIVEKIIEFVASQDSILSLVILVLIAAIVFLLREIRKLYDRLIESKSESLEREKENALAAERMTEAIKAVKDLLVVGGVKK